MPRKAVHEIDDTPLDSWDAWQLRNEAMLCAFAMDTAAASSAGLKLSTVGGVKSEVVKFHVVVSPIPA